MVALLSFFARRLPTIPLACISLLLCGVSWGQNAPPGSGAGSEPPKLHILDQLGGFGGLGGAGGGDGQHVTLSASYTIDRGTQAGTLTVTAKIEPGWHIYSLDQPAGGPGKSEIKVVTKPDKVVVGKFQPDVAPHIKPPDVFKVPSHEHEGTVNWSAPIQLMEGAEPESLTIDLAYNGQVCAAVCIPIFGEKIAAKFAGYTEKSATPGEYIPQSGQGELVLKGHIEPSAIARGGKAKLVITAIPNPGWHVYAYAASDPDTVGANKPTLIHLAPATGWHFGKVAASASPTVKAPAGGVPEQRYYDQPVTWTLDIAAPADSPLGEVVISGYVGFQTCDDKSCLPPSAAKFRVSVPIKTAAEKGQIPLEFSSLSNSDDSGEAQGYRYVAKLAAAVPPPASQASLRELLPMVGFGLLGGLILNLMPCVLPVIGLKLLSFVQQGGHSRAKIFALNAWFAAGLLVVFIGLATLAAFGSLIPYLGQNLSWGQQFTFTSFKVAMVVVVFAFALSFLGVWEVPIPGFAQSSASSKLQHQEGAAGAFFKGVFTTLLATPCSGPFLGPVFAFTLTQSPLTTYIIFTSVGLGMASPYLAIGTFPALVRWLPRPGEWMETFKQLMGFVLLGTVVYLFSTINADYFVPTLALMMAVWLGCWIIGRVPGYEDTGKQIRQWAIGIATAGAIGWLSFAALGPTQELIEWQPYSPESLAKLQSEGKTVMVDFTAKWCLTCQYNTKTAINTRRVRETLDKNGVAPLLADWTDYSAAIKQKLADLNSNSIPLLAIYPANRPGDVIVLRDAITQNQLITALEKAGPSRGAVSLNDPMTGKQVTSAQKPAAAGQ